MTRTKSTPSPTWTPESSAQLYHLDQWGNGLFHITDGGELAVRLRCQGQSADLGLAGICSQLEVEGFTSPVLLRFPNVIADRIELITRSFDDAIREAGGDKPYHGLYPIKVNQQRQVIEQIAAAGEPHRFGFEVGTKPELVVAMAHLEDGDRYLVCNGYKDRQYIDLALHASRIGMQVILVLEHSSEVALVVERSRELGVRPRLGLRTRLTVEGSGHWSTTSGSQSLFGLGIHESIAAVDELRREGMLDCLEMLHYHQGSQIPDIRAIEKTAREAALIYCGLVEEGAPMGLLNVGGGLAVDYDGSKTTSFSSRNYTTADYARSIVTTVFRELKERRVDYPVMLSESGRAIAAAYSVLVFNILGDRSLPERPQPDEGANSAHEDLAELEKLKESLSAATLQSKLIRSKLLLQRVSEQFEAGKVSLRTRALAEYFHERLLEAGTAFEAESSQSVSGEIARTKETAHTYYGNFSLFQSLPDAWAIDQLFPIMPLTRLDERPEVEVSIADITCDSDGRVKRYIDPHNDPNSLPLHRLRPDETYYVGVFLVGAYQETLGDMHNLLGYPNTVAVTLSEDGNIETELICGDSIREVITYVEYDPDSIRAAFSRRVHSSNCKLTDSEAAAIEDAYAKALDSYTYLDHCFE